MSKRSKNIRSDPSETMAKIGALIQRMVTAEENRGYSVPLRGLPYV